MRVHSLRSLVLVPALALSPAAPAAEGSVTIASPRDGAKLDARGPHTVSYEVAPGPGGHHVHLYVDGKEIAILRRLKGSHVLKTLAPGHREICVKVVSNAHAPIGVEKCIRVTVE